MDWFERQNDTVDELVKAYVKECIEQKRKHKPTQLWYQHFSLWIDGIKQLKVCKRRLYERLWRESIFKYWKDHHDFSIPSPYDIDWEPSRLAINQLPLGLKRWFAKFATGCIGNKHKFNQRSDVSAKCPNCSHPVEKSSHVLLCNDSKTKSNFNSNMKQLKTTLSETKTLPRFQTAIIKILQNWRYGWTINVCEFTKAHGIRYAVQDQSTIGWNNFILGQWSQRWQLVQQQFIKQKESKRSSLRWTTSIIYKLLYVVWDIWNFRNFLVHGKGGINDKAVHKELNFQIRQQFTIGF